MTSFLIAPSITMQVEHSECREKLRIFNLMKFSIVYNLYTRSGVDNEDVNFGGQGDRLSLSDRLIPIHGFSQIGGESYGYRDAMWIRRCHLIGSKTGDVRLGERVPRNTIRLQILYKY